MYIRTFVFLLGMNVSIWGTQPSKDPPAYGVQKTVYLLTAFSCAIFPRNEKLTSVTVPSKAIQRWILEGSPQEDVILPSVDIKMRKNIPTFSIQNENEPFYRYTTSLKIEEVDLSKVLLCQRKRPISFGYISLYSPLVRISGEQNNKLLDYCPQREADKPMQLCWSREDFWKKVLCTYPRLMYQLMLDGKIFFLEKKEKNAYVTLLGPFQKAFWLLQSAGYYLPQEVLLLIIDYTEPIMNPEDKLKNLIQPGIIVGCRAILDLYADEFEGGKYNTFQKLNYEQMAQQPLIPQSATRQYRMIR